MDAKSEDFLRDVRRMLCLLGAVAGRVMLVLIGTALFGFSLNNVLALVGLKTLPALTYVAFLGVTVGLRMMLKPL